MKSKLLLFIVTITISLTQTFAQVEGEKYTPGRGFKIVNKEWGNVNFRLYSNIRYLNQIALEDSFTNSFGKTTPIQKRQDIQLNKVIIYLFGWILDPKFHYLSYVWTTNVSQGLSAQVVVAGNLTYNFNEHITLGAGIGGLPGTRSTEGNWPNWLAVDNRLIADEFSRPSYTTGIWANGNIVKGLNYNIMLGNNLSQLGVDAGQLDNGLNTWSMSLVWMPTTGEFGTNGSYGDFDIHENLATRFGLHFTTSDEDKQSQPNSEAIDNVQIRLSDGSIIFTSELFGSGIAITNARYNMVSFDAAVKYKGFSLEGEYFWRTVNDIRGYGIEKLSFSNLVDNAFQLQASSMIIDQTLQIYLAGSKIFGEYGNPSDARFGANLYPFDNKAFMVNGEVIYLDKSPVGALSLPYVVGGKGPVFHIDLELNL